MNSLIPLLIVGLGIWLLYRLLTAGRISPKRSRTLNKGAQPSSINERSRALQACAHCGLHVQQADCIKRGGEWFCSEEHYREQKQSPDSQNR